MLHTVWKCFFGIYMYLFYYKCILQHDEEPTAQVMNLAHLLETCQFREFWVNKILLLLFFSLLQLHCFVILLWMKYIYRYSIYMYIHFKLQLFQWIGWFMTCTCVFSYIPINLIQGALRTNPDLTANIRGFDDSIRKCKLEIPAYQSIKLVMYMYIC